MYVGKHVMGDVARCVARRVCLFAHALLAFMRYRCPIKRLVPFLLVALMVIPTATRLSFTSKVVGSAAESSRSEKRRVAGR